MKAVDAVAEVLKREGVEVLIAYPVNHVIEAAARLDIRTIIVRQERIGLHMADAISRLSSGKKVGVFAMQHGPGAENAFGGVAQAYGESVPILVLPMGYGRSISQVKPNFSSALNFRHVTKSAEAIVQGKDTVDIMRRAFTGLRNGPRGPALVEIPGDVMNEEIGDVDYRPTHSTRSGPDPDAVAEAVDVLLQAKRPVLYAGQGVHYAEAWPQLAKLSELLAAPVTTSLQGKSAFPETHPMSLGSGGRAISKQLHEFLQKADVIFGIGCSFTTTNFGVAMPKGKTIIHATLDPSDLNKNLVSHYALIGDAGLTLDMINAGIESKLGNQRRDAGPVADEIATIKQGWLAEWMPKLTSDETPLSPYRVIWDLQNTVDRDNTIITHDAGSPRDQISPFWETTTPLSYIGWGKTTQLGYGLGLAMGAKLAHPEKLCINFWGDAAIGFTGMDFETAVRERIPILSVLCNNFSMAIELKVMPVSTEKFRSTDISGDYAAMARAFGGFGERVTTPDQIVPAIKRGIEATEKGQPALLEFITAKETSISSF